MMKLMLLTTAITLTLKMTRVWATQILPLLLVIPLSAVIIPLTQSYSPSPFLSISTISIILISLSIWLTILMFLASLSILMSSNHPTLFSLLTLILLMSLLITFSTNSLLKFYIAFETTLIPTAALIMYWGPQPERVTATMYMLMYTLTASIPLLMTLLMIMNSKSTLSMVMPSITAPLSQKLTLLMIGAFLVKLPMYTLHQWLPKAHVEAPVAGSMILAGVLLKLGAYGMFMMLNLNTMMPPLNHFLMSLSIIGATTTALLCLRQNDIKALIAYASVSHMSIMLTAFLTQSFMATQATVLMLIAHGLTSSGLFAMVNIIYESYKTRNMFSIKSILTYSPIMTLWWFLLICSNIATPPFINLPAEMLIISSLTSISFSLFYLLIPMLILLTSTYSLILYTSSIHGLPPLSTNPSFTTSCRNNLLMISHIVPLIFMMMMLPTLSQ